MFLSMIKAVVFDLDDTLYPELEFQKSGFDAIAKYLKEEHCPEITRSKIIDTYRRNPKRCFQEIIKQYKIPVQAKLLIELYKYHNPNIRLFPSVQNVLEKLRKKFMLKLGLISDYDYRTQQNKFAALGIQGLFDSVIFTDTIGAPKPKSKAFQMTIDELKCLGDSIIYVGDNEQKDFIGARKNGFKTIKFTHPKGIYKDIHMPKRYKADYEIGDHKEIISIIKILNQ